MKEVLCACFKIVVVFLHIRYAYKSPQSRILFEIGLRRTGNRRSPTREGSQLKVPTLAQYQTTKGYEASFLEELQSPDLIVDFLPIKIRKS